MEWIRVVVMEMVVLIMGVLIGIPMGTMGKMIKIKGTWRVRICA